MLLDEQGARPDFDVLDLALATGLRCVALRFAGDATIATADLIDPVTGQASAPVKLVGPRYHAAAILLPDHRALIVSGSC